MVETKVPVRRCLFGRVDPNETDDYLRKLSLEIDEKKKAKWGFDFKAGRPVPEGHPVYEWFTVGADDAILGMYHRIGEAGTRKGSRSRGQHTRKRHRKTCPKDAVCAMAKGGTSATCPKTEDPTISGNGACASKLENVSDVISTKEAEKDITPQSSSTSVLEEEIANSSCLVYLKTSQAIEITNHLIEPADDDRCSRPK